MEITVTIPECLKEDLCLSYRQCPIESHPIPMRAEPYGSILMVTARAGCSVCVWWREVSIEVPKQVFNANPAQTVQSKVFTYLLSCSRIQSTPALLID